MDDAHKEYKWEGSATENTDELTVTTHTLCVRQVKATVIFLVDNEKMHFLLINFVFISTSYIKTNVYLPFQIVLGPDAKDDEVNVVEVECFGYENKKYKIPIAVLKAGSGSHVVTTEVNTFFNTFTYVLY